MGNNVPYIHSSDNEGWTEVLSAQWHPLNAEENCHWQNRFKCSWRTWSFQSLDLPVKRPLTVCGHVHICRRSILLPFFCSAFTKGILNEVVLPHKKPPKYAYVKLFSIHEYKNELSRMFNSLKDAWTSVLPSWWAIMCCFFAEAGNIAVIPDSSGFLLIFAIPRDGGRAMEVPLWFSYYVMFVHWLKGEQLI